MKIQPYFESGFPYGHDQWISQSGTAWATLALSVAAPQPPPAIVGKMRSAHVVVTAASTPRM